MVVLEDDHQVGQRPVADLVGDPQVDTGVGGDPCHRHQVDVLHHQRPHPAGHDGRDRRGDRLDGGEGSEQGGLVVRAGVESEGRPGHQGQGALRANDQLGEVVAAGRLHELAAGLDDLAGAQHRLDAQDVVAGHPVLHRPHPPGIGGDVAAQAGRLLTGEHGVQQLMGDQGGVEVVQRHPRLDHGHVVIGVDLDDAVHPLERHHQPAFHRGASPGKPGPRSPRGERYSPTAGQLHDGRDFGGRPGAHHRQRSDRGRGQRLVVGVVILHARPDVNVGETDDVGQLLLEDRPGSTRSGNGRDRLCRW